VVAVLLFIMAVGLFKQQAQDQMAVETVARLLESLRRLQLPMVQPIPVVEAAAVLGKDRSQMEAPAAPG
jgi:hypothetical protein